MRLIEEFLQDLRYGKRLLTKNPGVTLIAIVTLALGIGANTAIFSVVDAFLLRPLPYPDADRLVMVDSQQRGQSTGVSFADYEDWRSQNNVFENLAFFNLRWNANLDFGNETETLDLTFGTANLFSTLQVAPLLGHTPTAADTDTVLLSYGLWQRRFGSDPAIVGRQLRIDGNSLTVAGVMPPDFRFPFQSDLWWLSDRYFNRQKRDLRIDQTMGRLKPGVSSEQARAEMQQIAARLEQTYPDTNTEVTATVVPLRDFWFGKLRRSFWLLLGACGFVLLIVCANVANLLMTQATAREREMAVGDVKHNSLVDEAGYDLYFACYQSYSKQTHFVARMQGDPMALAKEIQRAIWQVAPDTGVFNVMPVTRLSTNTVWQSRVWGLLFGIFSGTALVLATAGIYGVMAYFVTQRTREIGIRIALGAQWRDVLKLIFRSGMLLVTIGLTVGLVAALALTRLMSSLLFEVSPTDPITFGAVVFCVIVAALLACYIPARRATKVDPLIALRYE